MRLYTRLGLLLRRPSFFELTESGKVARSHVHLSAFAGMSWCALLAVQDFTTLSLYLLLTLAALHGLAGALGLLFQDNKP